MPVPGLPLGVLAARCRNTWADALLRIVSLAGVTMPGFLFAILLQLGAACHLTDWPIPGRISREFAGLNGPTGLLSVDGLLAGRLVVTAHAPRHQALPALALSISGIGQIMRISCSAMIEHQRRGHVQFLRSFGVPDRVVMQKDLNAVMGVLMVARVILAAILAPVIASCPDRIIAAGRPANMPAGRPE